MSKFREKLNKKIDGIGETRAAEKWKMLSGRFVEWADGNRKKMYVITMSFVFLCFVVSLIFSATRIGRTERERVKMERYMDSVNAYRKEKGRNVQKKYMDYQQYKAYEEEIGRLAAKDTLTSEDSLRINELYMILLTNEIK